MKFGLCMVFVICSALVAESTDVKQCQGGQTRKLESSEVAVTNCHKGVCKLRRKTDVGVEIKFTPEKDIKDLTTTVSAEILGIALPFIGVDGTSACENVYLEDGVTKTKCPLVSGQNYVYKNSFKILELYPKLNLIVRWSLTTRNRDVVCFELPAKIL